MSKAEAKKSSIAVRNASTGKYLTVGPLRSRTSVKASVAEPKAAPKTAAGASTVMSVATRVAGSKPAADRWYGKPNDLLGGRTPKRAVKDGDGERVIGLLLTVAGQ